MRSNQQINFIKSTQSFPEQQLNFIDNEQVENLKNLYVNSKDKLKKNTGPTVLKITGNKILDPIIKKLKKRWGDFDVRYAHIFDVSRPHIIHNDDEKELPNAYKAFLLPLYVENGNDNDAKLILFDQYYYGGPAKFFNGYDHPVTVHYNDIITDYKEIDGIVQTKIDKSYYNENLTHLQKEWLEGLSVSCDYPWRIGSCIAFDSLQLHCASDFNNKGITRKIGLTIFTTISL